ncbi:MAG: alpha/beta fold hydrolase [Rhodanobacter sp.]|nr:MAG: alpha/beta fold hydrolase [Rhodanobacter sp.]TAM01186.1 MAG: alpha/beta fold hydrolase [Rhodanobacter sp.]TAM39705.1 MAG: alpha/beta fold hydrolase [Rhodanobacter sp.]TAN25280.1 MAG: alpha/beta fold hydrolase [Rhodanobacter sp.]
MLRRRLKFLAWLVALLVIVLGGSYLFAPQWLMRANFMRELMAAKLDKQSVQAGDTRWVYYEGGTGPTIVLLHGFASSKEVWLPVAKLLTPHFHLIIPDLPGWGESSRNAQASYDIDAQAARLDAFVQALRLRRFVLVGHSMGGAIAGVYATMHPQHVGELALVDAFGLKARPNAFDRQALAGNDPFVFDDRAGFARAVALAFEQPPQIPGRFVDVLVKRNQHNHAFIQRTFDALRQPSQYLAVQHRLGQLTMPVLGLWCHDDKIVDISALNSLRNGLTAASAISTSTLNGCNHMPMLEKPAETAQILTGFALSH